MTDNPNPNGPQGDPAPSDEPAPDLGEGGKKALTAERDARKAAETAVKDLQKQLDEATSKLAAVTTDGLPEWQQQINALKSQLDGEVTARKQAENEAAQAKLSQLRLDRATAKSLPPVLAKKLTGTTAEDIDAEIDELLPLVTSGGPRPNPQQGTPSHGRGGSVSAGRERYAAQHPK